MKRLPHLLLRLIRIYTPFICSIMALVNGVFYMQENPSETAEAFYYNSSAITGNSLLLVTYIFSTSMRMCIWFKINLVCLMLVQVTSLVYDNAEVEMTLYPYIAILLAILGIICYLIFRVFYTVTSVFGCSRRY